MLNKLTHRIDILAPNPQQDSTGGPLPQVLLVSVWAGVEDLTGREAYSAQQFASDVNVKFTVRYHPSITAACMVAFEGKLYSISYTRDPASAQVSQPFRGNVAGQPRLLRNTYTELFCALYNDRQA